MSRDEEGKKRQPLVSVVTPSYQQGSFIRETIESVLSQDYPNVELIVMDGGSKDHTVQILQKYADKHGDRFRFVSEKDRGQSHALNKGLALARGEIIGWLNSDDTYEPKAISRAVSALMKHPEYGLVYGKADFTDKNNNHIRPYPIDSHIDRARLFDVCTICQPAVFMRKSVLDQVGPIDESLHFCMDYDLWMRIAAMHKLGYIDEPMAHSRLHDDCKSMTQYFTVGLPEIIRTSLKNYGTVSNHWLIQFIAHHLPEGAAWIMERMKPFRIFGRGPQITSSDRFEDGWAPPVWNLEIRNDSEEEVQALVIGGNHQLPKLDRKRSERLELKVAIGGEHYKTFKLGEGRFTLQIPLKNNLSFYSVEIRSNVSFSPARLKLNGDERQLSFKVTGAAPLSPMEARLYKLLEEEPASVGEWLMRKRKFKW
ncbi:glycosyltransferase family 2 protein [Paenibacillus ginsengarvi]|uniref:Glycosyltransferase n=1 Tax=Paenibacillus ginsengarvi TaxID=400777 RepID=A0A3B0CJW0_9BACL|nr:glycosyltransferase family 2 protein [Paenibacillus ginsengarvi]RKN85300.1 glycosyltransferase [Paenibacillus ginsengarvi]